MPGGLPSAWCHLHIRLLIFLLAILIPACASSSPAFLMIYSAYKLNKQDDNIQPWGTPFPIWNQSGVPCPVLTVASWPAYRFLQRQVRWSGIPISFRIFHMVEFFWNSQYQLINKITVENAKTYQLFFLGLLKNKNLIFMFKLFWI